MTIGVHLNRLKVPFANFVKSFEGTSENDDESEINQNYSSEGIYTDDSNERETWLYVLKAILKVGVLF
jgi:hypothetical protein